MGAHLPVIEVKNIWKRYSEREKPVLRGVFLTVETGDFIAISGSSGSGKSTLLSILGCLDVPSEGEVWLGGVNCALLNDISLTRLRAARIGFVFQRFNLIPTLRVIENVEYPLLMLGLARRERQRRALEALGSVGISDFARRFPRDLSGGQQQRVAIARAIVKKPSLVLADEPTASLDHANALNVLETMRILNRELKTTFIFSSHDPLVLNFAERKIALREGQLEKDLKHVA